MEIDDPQTSDADSPVVQSRPLWQRIRLFEGLDADAITAISGHLVLRSFTAGDVLIQQDRWCGELFILHAGVAHVRSTQFVSPAVTTDASPEIPTRETILRRLVGGDCFGEMSLITGTLPSATVQALTDGDAWVLGQDAFQQLALDFPTLTRNINVILSERLFHTSRQNTLGAPQQITVVIAESSPLWDELARAVSSLTRRAILFVDFNPAANRSGRVYQLRDLLSGRLNGALMTRADQPDWDHYDTIVLDESPAAGTVGDLLGVLSRLEDHYSHVLILVPPSSPHLTPPLLAVATRVLVAGPIESAAAMRSILSSLPMPATLSIRPEVGAIVTNALSTTLPTVAALDTLNAQVGIPVRGVIPASDAHRATAIAALARWLAGQRIGLALGGGGVKGWAHLGVLRVLRRLHVPFDCVTGVSIGAICAAMIARGGTLEEYENLLRIGSNYAFRVKFSRVGLLSSRGVEQFLRRKDVVGERLIEDLPIPFATVAADLNSGSEIVIRRGLVWQAVLASSSIPALFPPVRIGAHYLVDGAVVNPVPISTAQLLGADKIIAVDISTDLAARQEITSEGRSKEKLPNVVNSMLRSFEIMAAQIRVDAAEECCVLIKPHTTAVSLRRFRDGSQFVEAGEAATEAALPQIFREFPWLERQTR
jgi:NTE family protein